MTYLELTLSITNIVMAAGIVLFAGKNWQATKHYAETTALEELLIRLGNIHRMGQSVERRAAIEAMKIIRQNFPALYQSVAPHFSKEVQEEVSS